ncbi:nucleotide-diphospho-sugar transferase [Mollisia scopiformis]|uniref:glycogenin glucosyltransferase n=1 Tax=Mollisia scopiformis TaxID=149040 RepID=A0A194XL20_MOLSC|nr:nucleotide-diphospho-sugar transferase [Mollisia scopiformis]KUJ20930.1 nucleotide-diphospho-sugar transferase [Mollisia scopiformis]
MASPDQDVYMTLLTSDRYLPGALVVAHSLRDAGTTKKLAILVTTDTVSADAMAQLQTQFDFIIPVERFSSDNHTNLALMNRPDLHSTFTKINLWRQVQFRKIVYVDADMVALRAPDELFGLPDPFSAAPDIGWPDIFNTGLMVLTPNMGDYYALKAMADRGISFDGADQGLLNMHFKNTFNRLSFTYNVTPSAHYQYLPAFRHFQSSISMAHFIGQEKPWMEGRDAHMGSTPYDQMVGTWWAVYDRHYKESVGEPQGDPGHQTEDRQQSVDSSSQGASTIVHYHTKGEFQPIAPIVSQAYQPEQTDSEIFQPTAAAEQSLHETTDIPRDVEVAYVPPVQTNLETHHDPPSYYEPPKEPEVQYSAWDASRAPPPSDSKPEASNFPATHYDMSSDLTPFQAPERYPDPPKDMWYEVPKTPTYQKPAPIFPWEKDAAKPTRVFPEDNVATETFSSSDPTPNSVPSAEDARGSTPVTPTTPTIQLTTADPWQTYTRSNAWDEIPEIERYIGNLQKSRKGNIQLLQGYGSGIAQVSSPGGRRHSMKLTDFPTELERPSLPVTPAPIRRPSFWGEERDEEGELPAAEGVPSQEDWDPAAELEKLARRQSVVLANKLGMDGAPAREIPLRPLPYGSEGVTSPTYVAQVPPSSGAKDSASGSAPGSDSTPRTTIEEPSYHGPGAMWEKDETFPVKETPAGATEEEKDVLET